MHRLRLFLCLLIIIFYPSSAYSAFDSHMDVHFIDVGQGDSILIETPSDKTILIDGGPPQAGKKVVSYLNQHGVETIDLLISTHPDKDHIGGLPDVIKNFNVKKVLDTGKVHITKTYYNYTKEIRKHGIPMEIAEENEQIQLDPLVQIDILNANDKRKSNNESSIALKVTYRKIDFLLLSDIEKEQEEKIRKRKETEAEILKVAHHGSKTSSTYAFLQAVNPQVAILTYSKDNKYGHPVNRVIDYLYETDALIYSTAAFGDLVITTNGDYYFIMPKETPISKLVKSS